MKSWTWIRDVVIIAIGVGMVILMTGIRDEQAAGKERGYDTRAVACRLLMTLSQPVENDPQCSDPNVMKRVDAYPIEKTKANALICKHIVLSGQKVDGCD